MSTNYYWHDMDVAQLMPTHIGKLTGGRFLWAQDPEMAADICEKYDTRLTLVVDEYDDLLSGDDFLVIVESVPWEMSSVGHDFT